jgi:hypothetical protein
MLPVLQALHDFILVLCTYSNNLTSAQSWDVTGSLDGIVKQKLYNRISFQLNAEFKQPVLIRPAWNE